MNRFDSIESVMCAIRVFRDGMWYQQKPLLCFVPRARKIISRMRRMGKTINVTWLTGM